MVWHWSFVRQIPQAGRMSGMEAIPLAEGDLRWVFPDLVDEAEIREILRQAAGCVEQLAGLLEVRPSWTGGGLEFLRLPGQPLESWRQRDTASGHG
jgi:hypothetical protein